MPKSIIDAVKQGLWDFEPCEVPSDNYENTPEMPGTKAKLKILAERVKQGLPLWHPSDRRELDEDEYERCRQRAEDQQEPQILNGIVLKPR